MGDSTSFLPLHDKIVEIIPEQSSVLDLGCGYGELLSKLVNSKSVRAEGVEIDVEATVACLRKGLSVYHGNLDDGLQMYGEASFDYVILSETLQVLRYPLKVLKEMLRVGKNVVVTFPNFGHWKMRLQLLLHGKMPRSSTLPHEWYHTPNIHLCTIRDFEELCVNEGILPVYRHYQGSDRWPNLFAEAALFVVRDGK